MKIFVNRKIKTLFCSVLLAIAVFSLISAACAGLGLKNAAFCVLLSSAGMGLLVFTAMYLYFREQSKIMESAILQIRDYISGDRDARIECDDEGELYRLFQEVNSLVSILNAHAENEGRSKKFMKDTISDISHQLKTPLAALNIYNGLLQDEVVSPSEVKEFADLSEQELDRIETLVQNLLKITRLDAGSVVLEKKNENVAEMVQDIARQYHYRAEQEQKKLVLSGSEAVTLWCDRDWMQEAVDNLVKNALDHTKSGDTIQVEWNALPSMVQIKVRDNGSGIHPEDLYHIFKRFYRSRFSQDTQGIGLGLPLAKAVVEAHHGTIEVDSELGKGTTFTLNFPIPTKL